MDLFLDRDVADDAVRPRVFACDALDPFAAAGEEGYLRPAAQQLADERQPQARCAAGDGHPHPGKRLR